MLVYLPVFIGRYYFSICSSNTKNTFLCIVDAFNMHRMVFIIGKCFHVIENDPVNNKDGESHYKTSCCQRSKK